MDYVLIGKILGAIPLGLYTLAYRFLLLPVTSLAGVASQALFPAFARLQSDSERLSSAYLKVARYVALVTFPAMAVCSIMSVEVIRVVFGDKWIAAAPALRYLALIGTFQPLVSLYGTVILARGFAGWYFRWGLVVSLVMVVSFAVGLHWGIEGVAAAYLYAQVAVTITGLPILLRKGETPLNKFVAVLRVPLLATLGMSAVVLPVKIAMTRNTSFSNASVLTCCTVAAACAYACAISLQQKTLWTEIMVDLQHFRRGERWHAAE